MKKLALLAASLLLASCNEGGFWSGSMTAYEPMAILGADGQVTMEIAAGSKLSAALYQEPDRTWSFDFRDATQQRSASIRVPLRTSSFRYGQVYHLNDFGQNFDVSVLARLAQKDGQKGWRYESCYEFTYVCGFDWKDGEYKHVCEHKNVPGTRRVEYVNYSQREVVEGEFFNQRGEVIGDFELSRDLGVKERVLDRGTCEPNVR